MLLQFIITFIATIIIPASSQHHQKKALEHLQRGNDAYGAGNLQNAASHYETCLTIDPSLQWCVINLASVLVDLGQDLPRAEYLYRNALEANPSDGDAAFNLAMLLQDRKTEETTREAALLYDIAVKEDSSRWDAWANMASALSELKEEPLKAIYAFERSIVLIEKGADEDGDENQERDAYLSKLYYGYGMTLSELTSEACAVLANAPQSLLVGRERAVASKDKHDMTLLCSENAQNAMKTASRLDATNVLAAHVLAAMTGGGDENGPSLKRATPEFVSALFDDFADTFDEKLGALEYKVPRLVGGAAARAAQTHRGKMFRSALDAGCGTGLAGPYLRSVLDGPMIGVDLSKKMLDIAADCTIISGCGAKDNESDVADGGDAAPRLYDGLMSLDLETMTLQQTLGAAGVTRKSEDYQYEEGFELVIAADVLVYFGKLKAVIENFAKVSQNGASLIFSCERADDTDQAPLGWRLLLSGRFAHTKAYVVEVATSVGYELVDYEEIVPRMEKGKEVQGHLFSFVLRRHDGSRGGDGDDEL